MTKSLDDLPIRPVLKALVNPPVFKPVPPGVRFMQFNEGAWPPSPKVTAAIAAAAGQVNRYGDSHWSKLAPAIAARSGVANSKRVSATIRNSASAEKKASFVSADGPWRKNGGGVRSKVPSDMAAARRGC